jgi:hypothetical protein
VNSLTINFISELNLTIEIYLELVLLFFGAYSIVSMFGVKAPNNKGLPSASCRLFLKSIFISLRKFF